MAFPDAGKEKGGGMAIMLGIGKKKPADMEAEADSSSAEQDAVQSFFEAGQSGDWAAATDAFKTAYDLCSSAPIEEEDDDEYPEATESEL